MCLCCNLSDTNLDYLRLFCLLMNVADTISSVPQDVFIGHKLDNLSEKVGTSCNLKRAWGKKLMYFYFDWSWGEE